MGHNLIAKIISQSNSLEITKISQYMSAILADN